MPCPRVDVYNGVENAAWAAREGALCHLAIIHPVNSSMRLWHEEQFGPVIPVATFDNQEIIDYGYISLDSRQPSSRPAPTQVHEAHS